MRWNGAMSSFLDRLHGVAQGTKAGPLIFIFVTMVNFALLKSAVGYADDTSNASSLVAGLNEDSKVIVSLSVPATACKPRLDLAVLSNTVKKATGCCS